MVFVELVVYKKMGAIFSFHVTHVKLGVVHNFRHFHERTNHTLGGGGGGDQMALYAF